MKKPFYRLELTSGGQGIRSGAFKDFRRKKDCETRGQSWVAKRIMRLRRGSASYRCKKITVDMWWVR